MLAGRHGVVGLSLFSRVIAQVWGKYSDLGAIKGRRRTSGIFGIYLSYGLSGAQP